MGQFVNGGLALIESYSSGRSVHPISASPPFASAPHFAFPVGFVDGMPNEEVTGPGFGFSFLGFRFSRLLFCSRFAMTGHLSDWVHFRFAAAMP